MKIKVTNGVIDDGKEKHPPGKILEVDESAGRRLIDLKVAEEVPEESETDPGKDGDSNAGNLSAKEKIELVAAAATIEAVKELLKDEERVTVVDAGKARIKELKK